MSAESHLILDGKARLYRYQGSRHWHCAIFLDGRNRRASPRQDRLALAIEVGREWALDRLAEDRLRKRGFDLAPRDASPAPRAATGARSPDRRSNPWSWLARAVAEVAASGRPGTRTGLTVQWIRNIANVIDRCDVRDVRRSMDGKA